MVGWCDVWLSISVIDMTITFERLLFLQKAEVIESQKGLVRRILSERWPAMEIVFASSPEAIPLEEFPVVIAPTISWLPEALGRIKGCRWIHFLSAGVEKIWDMPVDWNNYLITKSSGIHAQQMSEYAIGAMLYFAKSFDRFTEQSKARVWSRFWLDELTGQTVTILGAGAVGRAVAERTAMFGMRTVAVRRSEQPVEWAESTHSFREIERAVSSAAYLVVSVPLTDESRGLVDYSVFRSLPKNAVLVDISRGGVVVEKDLIRALDDGCLRGAALDVFEEEPLPPDSVLWGRSNVLITPHASGTSPYYLQRAVSLFIANANSWIHKGVALTPVDMRSRY